MSHNNQVESVYQQVSKTALYVVFESKPITEVTNVFITREQCREQYDNVTISPGTEHGTGEVFMIYGDGQVAYIKADPLINQALEALATKKFFPFTQPVTTTDWYAGLARFNPYFAVHGLKYVNAKNQFVKAPAPKEKPCPKPVIYALKKLIIDSGCAFICNQTGASITFGSANPREVDGSAYLAKRMGAKYKTLMFNNGGQGQYDENENWVWVANPKLTFDQQVDRLGLTPNQKKELLNAIADWWKGLAAPSAE